MGRRVRKRGVEASSDGNPTWVPPSPGRLLYHKDLWGPERIFWSWLPWAKATEAQPRAKIVGCIMVFEATGGSNLS